MALIDLHQDTPRHTLDPDLDLLQGSGRAQVDLPRLEGGGALAVGWAACDEFRLPPAESAARVTRMFVGARDLIARSGGRLRLVTRASDLDACAPGGPVGVLLALEGAHSLVGSLAMFDAYHALGLRILILTWNHRNPFASGCRDAIDEGLTPLGRELILHAQRLGVVLDLSHASPRTFVEALALLDRPFLVSHTACAALQPHPRNLTDAQMRAVADRAGVLGIMLYPPFLAGPDVPVSAATVAAHVKHAVAVAGEEAVAIGTDFDGMPVVPMDLRGFQDLPRLAAALTAIGLGAATIEKVMWRNAARVLRAGLREG